MSKSSIWRLARRGRRSLRTNWTVTSVPPKSRRAMGLRASGAALAMALVFSPMPSFSQNQCGLPVGDAATCTAAGGPVNGNPFEEGVQYLVGDLTLSLDSDVEIDPLAPVQNSLEIISTNSGDIIVNGADTEITNSYADGGVGAYLSGGSVDATLGTVTTNNANATGIRAQTTFPTNGDVAITVDTVDADNAAGSDGIDVYTTEGNILVNATTVSATQDGVVARSSGGGNVDINLFGVTGVATYGYAAYGYSDGGYVNVSSVSGSVEAVVTEVNTGVQDNVAGVEAASVSSDTSVRQVGNPANEIVTGGTNSAGAVSFSLFGNASAYIYNVTTTGDGSVGVDVAAGEDASVTVTGSVLTTGEGSAGVVGISGGAGSVTINVADVTTQGNDSDAIEALSDEAGVDGLIDIYASGTVTTEGDNSRGVEAVATGGAPIIIEVVDVYTEGADADAIYALASSDNADADIEINAQNISATGAGSNGVNAVAYGGYVEIYADDITANQAGIIATSDATQEVPGTTASEGVNIDVLDVDAGTTGIQVTVVSDDGYYSGNTYIEFSEVDAGGDGVVASSDNGYVSVDGGDITTGGAGVVATSSDGAGTDATGNVVVSVGGVSATGGTETGITATSDNGYVEVDADYVYGYGDGIVASSTDTGAGSVTDYVEVYVGNEGGDAINVTGTGIIATSSGETAGDVTVEVEGNVYAGDAGIVALSLDESAEPTPTTTSGSVDVTVDGNVTAGTGVGVVAGAVTESVSVTVTGDTVSTDDRGINAFTYTGDSVTVSTFNADTATYGSVTGGTRGVSVYSESAATHTVEVGDVTANGADAGDAGVRVLTLGEGNIVVSTGNATADAGNAILATNAAAAANGGYIDVYVDGDAYSTGNAAVVATSYGDTTDYVTVNVIGETTSLAAEGIIATSGGTTTAGDVTVTTGDTVTGVTGGIVATSGADASSDSGNVVVTATGLDGDPAVTTTYGTAIAATAAGTTGDVTVNATGLVDGAEGGVSAYSYNGNIYVDVDDVYVDGNGADPLDAVGVVASTVDGALIAIDTGNIDSTGTGITAYNDEATSTVGVEIDIDVVGNVDAVTLGIDATSANSAAGSAAGPVNVYVSGDLVLEESADNDVGINAESLAADDGYGGLVEITVNGNVDSGYGDGVNARSNGDDVIIAIGGDVTALVSSAPGTYEGGGYGIVANTTANGAGGNVDITVGNVSAYVGGIDADADLDIDIVAGDVLTVDNYAISADSDAGNIDIDSGSITSVNAGGVFALANAGTVDVYVDGDIEVNYNGVLANAATDVTVDVNGSVTTEFYDGVNASSTAGGTIIVTVDGPVDVGEDGVETYNYAGNTDIDVYGDITASGDGIDADAYQTGDIDVYVDGSIDADQYGVLANFENGGAANIDVTGDVTSNENTAIYVINDGAADTFIDIGGTVSGYGNGVTVDHNAEGEADVYVEGSVLSTYGAGVVIDIEGEGDATVEIEGDELTAYNEGISIELADGDAGVFVAGVTTSTNESGVDIEVETDGNVTVDLDDSVYVYNSGVEVDIANDGDATVTVDGTVLNATTYDGVNVYIGGNGSVDVVVTADITAGEDGVSADVNGDGNVDIEVTGDIDAGNYGVYASLAGDGNIDIDVIGDIEAAEDGVYSYSTAGDGYTTDINVTGNIDAGYDGVDVYSSNSDVTVLVDGNIDAGDDGVNVYAGYAMADVTVTGDIGSGGDGVEVTGSNGDTMIDVDGNILAGENGVLVDQGDAAGYGDTTVDVAGYINAGTDGVSVTHASGGFINIYVGDYVTAAETGVSAATDGGQIDIEVVGPIDAGDDAGDYGVFAESTDGPNGTQGGANITVADVEGGNGIFASAYGDIYVEAGNVTATNAAGIGIEAIGQADGVVVVTALDVVNADTATYDTQVTANGGRVEVYQTDGSIEIYSTGVVIADDDTDAIYAKTLGTNTLGYNDGSVSIEVASPIETSGVNSDGIYAYGDYITIVADAVTTDGVGSNGIDAYSVGQSVSSGVVIALTGDVTINEAAAPGEEGFGISAEAASGSVIVDINDGASVLTSGDYVSGVLASVDGEGLANDPASPYGTPVIDINIEGAVDTEGEGGVGIFASHGAGDVVIEVAGVYTDGTAATGIAAFAYVDSYGYGGNIDIVVGDVETEGENADGVLAGSYGGGITITTGDVTVTGDGSYGIIASANESLDGVPGGAVIIDAGNVSSLRTYDVYAYSNGGRIDAQTVTGAIRAENTGVTTTEDGEDGIRAVVLTPGDTDYVYAIATGDIVTQGDGAFGVRAIGGGLVTVTTQAVTTEGDGSTGIYANAYGGAEPAELEVAANGTVTTSGAGSAGIVVTTNYGDVLVNAQDVYTTGANSDGINATVTADNAIDTTLTIDTTGYTVSATGAGSDGIYARNNNGNVVVVTGDVTGNVDGIYALGYGVDDGYGVYSAVAVDTTDGTVTTVDGTGIEATGYNGSVVVLADDVTSTNGYAIEGYALDGDLTIIADETAGGTTYDVAAETVDGRILVDINVGSVTAQATDAYSGDAQDGIFIRTESVGAEGAVNVLATGTIQTNADDSNGIYVYGGSPITVDANAVTTGGANSAGITVTSNADETTPSDVDIDVATVSTTGDNSTGIYVDSDAGVVDIDAGDVSTTGAGSIGINVVNSDGGDTDANVNVNTVTTAGADADGIVVVLDGEVDVFFNEVRTTGIGSEGIVASGDDVGVYGGDVFSTGTGITATSVNDVYIEVDEVQATEPGSNGISVTSGDDTDIEFVVIDAGYDGINVVGADDVDIIGGNVTAGNDGITVDSGDDTYISVGDVTAQNEGIYVRSEEELTVYADDVSGAGQTYDVDVESQSGSILVRVATGNVTATSNGTYEPERDGVSVTTGSDLVNILVDGAIQVVDGNNGVYVLSTETATNTITISENGSITTEDGLAIESLVGEDIVTITSNGDTASGDLNGYSELNSEADQVTFNGQTDFNGLEGIDAGSSTSLVPGEGEGEGMEVEDTDVLTFNDVRGGDDDIEANVVTIPAGGLTNFEQVFLNNSLIGFNYGEEAGDQILATTYAGDSSFENGVFVQNGSILNLEDGDGIVGDVTVDAMSSIVANGNGLGEEDGGEGVYGGFDGVNTVEGGLSLAGTFVQVDGQFGDEVEVVEDAEGMEMGEGEGEGGEGGIGRGDELLLVAVATPTTSDSGADDVTIFTGTDDSTATLVAEPGSVLFQDVEIGRNGVVASDAILFDPIGELGEGGFAGTGEGELVLDLNITAVTAPDADDPVTLIGIAEESTIDVTLARDVIVDGTFFTPVLTPNDGIVLDTGGVLAEVAGVVAASDAFFVINKDFFGDLASRIGSGDALYRPGLSGATAGIWGRFSVTAYNYESGNSLASFDSSGVNSSVQLGADVFRADLGGGEVVFSLLGQFGSMSGDVEQQDVASVDGVSGDTDFRIRSYGGGAGVTFYGADQSFYVDVTALALGHDGEIGDVDFDSFSFSVGLEAGTRVPVADTISIVPKAQLVYHHTNEVDGGDLEANGVTSFLTDPDDASIIGDDIDSLEARLGAAVEIGSGTGQSLQFGGTLGYEFLGETETRFGGNEIDSDQGGLNIEAMMRGSADLGMATIFGEVRYKTDLDSDVDFNGVGGSVGVRVDF